MAANGFNVIDHVADNLDTLKQTEGVPAELASCHTAFVEGYVLEGHVPVQSVKPVSYTHLTLPTICGV